MRNRKFCLPFGVSIAVYALLTAVSARDVLRQPATVALHDAGDSLLASAIFHWTTTHVPFSHGWWQFPIFFPTRDTLAFSEHLLGLSVIATPLEWVTGHPLAAYNLTALLTAPLCGAAMFALAWYLTRSAAAAFLAGLAYAWAPFRAVQMPHIQMLAVFWAPASLLGLHAYIDTRRTRWLVVYGAAWLMQAMANGYSLFFFSVLVGLWVCWFVVARADWRALGAIAVTTVLAAVPLLPILYKYLVVQRLHGLTRSTVEMQYFSADAGALLCASPLVTAWGWLHVACGTEGQLFPGAALASIVVVGGAVLLTARTTVATRPWHSVAVAWICAVIGAIYLAIVGSVLAIGPWRTAIGPLRVSASSVVKPLLVAVPMLAIAIAIWWRYRRPIHWLSTLNFYLFAALIMWLLSLGPEVFLLGRDTHIPGLFNAFLYLPGVNGLRVPARFWMMSVLSLSTAVGLITAALLAGRGRGAVRAATMMCGVALLADGWVARAPAQAVPPMPLFPETLANRLVLQLPYGRVATDIEAIYQAVLGGWQSVNGYSGYSPNYHLAATEAVREEQGAALLDPFRAYGDVDVIVDKHDERLMRMVQEQPGVRAIENAISSMRYRLPQRGRVGEGLSSGDPVPVARLDADCAAESVSLALDGRPSTGWLCFADDGRAASLTVDVGRVRPVGSVVMTLGDRMDTVPAALEVRTSVDGQTWEPAWRGSAFGQAIRSGIASPSSLRLPIPFPPRAARYIRVDHPAGRQQYNWWISELEVWSSNTGTPDDSE